MIHPEDLKDIPIFSSLTEETKKAFSERAFRRKLRAGGTLLLEGDHTESCYFIASGHLRVLRMNLEGRVQVLARLTTGAPINLIPLLNKEKINLSTVEALTPAQLVVLTAADFDFLLTKYHDFSRALLRSFAERLQNMTQLAAGLSLYGVKTRLAQFLIDLANEPGAPYGWTQDEIATQIGTVRDVVGRILREFEDQGLIKRDRHQVILLNRKGLIDIVQKL